MELQIDVDGDNDSTVIKIIYHCDHDHYFAVPIGYHWRQETECEQNKAYGFTWSEEQLDATNKHVNITESASLPCDFTLTQSETDQSNTFLLVTWSREKPADSGKWETITVMSNAYGRKTLKDGSRFVPDDSKYGLTITRAAREDHTQYKCTVHASFFTSPATVKLHVHFAPTNTSFTTSDIVSGRTLQMKCHADAYPPATYEFSRGSDYLLTSKEGVYQIGTHTEEDNGRYWCTPRNYLGRGPSRFIDLPNEGDFSSRDDSNKDGVKLSEKMLYIIIALLAALCLIFVVGIILWALCRKRGVKDDSDSGQTRRIVPKCMVLNARSLAKPDAAPALYAELSSNKVGKDRADLGAGGGVAIICRNDWKIKVLNVADSFESETVWCIITTPNSEFYAASIYHLPNPVYDAAGLLDFMSDTWDQILLENPNAKIIIAGDINQLNISEFTRQHALHQMVKKHGSVNKGLVRSDHLVVTVPPLAPVKPSRKHVSLRDTRDHRKVAMDSKLEISKLKWAEDFNFENPEECVRTLNDRLWNLFDQSFPCIKVKMSSRDPPYMSPLIKHLCNVRNKTSRFRSEAENTIRQERINKLIRMNQVMSVQNESKEHCGGSKGWWDVANRITGRKSQGTPVSMVLQPDEINTYFQAINTDDAYRAPALVPIPEGCKVPSIDEHAVTNLLIHQKRTSSGPDEFPYWLWRDYSHHLAPVITKIFNSSLKHQMVPSLWKLANVTPIPKESPLHECNQLRPI
ncbi:predicted protein [Nematostella vectensis]|uniref:Ig-like domain-containing protein n=1 Tax=Nematostella vectensis TaxID=45351 RepID=A7SAT9_NEMVE|nr:predicted protein [Nematostella vectensis]|eukprot:XP_001631243.1 predicted protein [Nematostella vectensis]